MRADLARRTDPPEGAAPTPGGWGCVEKRVERGTARPVARTAYGSGHLTGAQTRYIGAG